MFEELLDNRDEQLFNKIMNNTQNVLYTFSSYTTGPKISQNVKLHTERDDGAAEGPERGTETRSAGVPREWGLRRGAISFGDMEGVPK